LSAGFQSEIADRLVAALSTVKVKSKYLMKLDARTARGSGTQELTALAFPPTRSSFRGMTTSFLPAKICPSINDGHFYSEGEKT
jgi:hypothetical protein